ncbi:MAG TPA: exodeoxyribonuclease I, partial [Oxalobacteraceae bacterium]|nr:exodeoxyribonuclease I [Oxalobacteraceae bacterium]
KDRVADEIGLPMRKPFFHVSGMVPAERGCIALVWPLAVHPTNKNEVIVWDLAFDPSELFALDADTIRSRMFSKADALP